MKKRSLAAFVFLFLLVSAWVMAANAGNHPVAVSPGSETGVVTVWQSCPTFSWSAVDQAASYRITVFESVNANIATYEAMAAMASPVVSKDIPGPALSWTLSADEKLKTGSQYTWYVQALDVNGNALGSWSGGRVFKVEQELRFAGVAEKLGEVLKSYGVKDETITNVLADMKSEVHEVVVSNVGRKNTPGLTGVKGTEDVDKTFYGYDAGASNTTGYANTFIGSNAGYSNTTGYCNSFLGFFAGYNNTGSFNTFIGHQTGYDNYGNYNTFLGTQAGLSNDGGSHNNFLGYQAGFSNSGGSYNTFLGNYSGKSNDNGFYNSFLGYKAGYSNTHGDDNTFLGYFSGYGNITGNNNTFLGYYSGCANTTGTDNTFLGYKTGYTNTSFGNTFVGSYSGYYDNTGNTNAFLGYYAGYNNNSGNANLFLGALSGYTNTTGYHNSFLGCSAGYYNNSGIENTFLGFDAGLSNTTGSYNTFLGSYAGSSNTTAYANTFIGYNAGYFNQTGVLNVLLGFHAGYHETGSNKLYISNSDASFPLIYGDFDSDIVAINGYLGIGRQAPSYPIHMASGAYCSAGGTWTNASSRSLKENIQSLSTDEAVDALNQLNPVKYNYKVDKADKHVGFIAEDVPDLVASADRKGLSPMDVTAVLTKVVQELKRENQDQQNVIQQQQKIISELQERMAKLEKK